MKRYICSLLIMAGLLFTWSCSEDFLERYPLDEISPQTFFTSSNDLKIFANRFYPLLPAHAGWSGGTFWYDKNSDNMVPGVNDTRLSGTRTIPTSGGGWSWSDIRQANYFFENLSNVEGSAVDINHYIGEVQFFKAFIYFERVKAFGDVPWITDALTTESPELFYPRDSRKLVVDSIIVNLDNAIANLKPKAEAEAGRINKEIAILFKARVCLYEGTWEKYHDGTDFGVSGSDGTAFIQMAATTADQLIQMGSYSIFTGTTGREYWDLFNQVDYTGNPEVMLWKKFDVGLDMTHNVNRYLPNGQGNIGISKDLVDSYLCTDGIPISVSPNFMGYDSIAREVLNRDPRLAQTIFLRGYPQTINSPGGGGDRNFSLPQIADVGEARATTGYALYKGMNPEYTQQYGHNIGTMGSIIFRYSEALLISAEAKAELGTISQSDIDNTVNVIRDRVGLTHLVMGTITTDPKWQFPTLSPIINEIRRERRVELACEGHRWDDMARWRAHDLIIGKRLYGAKYLGSNLEGAYLNAAGEDEVVIGSNLFVDADGFIDPYQNLLPSGYQFEPTRDYLSPIPTDELTQNDNLDQNPGW